MQSVEIGIQTAGRRGIHDLTDACERFLADVASGRDGLLHVFVPHATAGVVVMELGAGSEDDLMASLDRLLPRDDRWRHRHGAVGHGADHVIPLMVSSAVVLPVIGGHLELGMWQSVALVEPNPEKRFRQVRLSFLPG